MAIKFRKTVVLIGPSHPATGGIAQHNSRLAIELENEGHSVRVESWKSQYPRARYPGPEKVPYGKPEVGVPRHVVAQLTWYNPLSWIAAGARARKADVVAFNVPTPFHAIPYFFIRKAAGSRPKKVGIIHNVLPHEPHRNDRKLISWLLNSLDWIIVHGNRAVAIAINLGVDPEKVVSRSLPSPWLESSHEMAGEKPSRTNEVGLRALFFGTIRPYKGLDVLLDAVAAVPKVELLVAGAFWEDSRLYSNRIQELGLEDRVEIRAGYVAEADFAELFSLCDVLVLPYQSGTGSIVRELGFRFGLPVIATNVGAISESIIDGETGRIVESSDLDALSRALKEAADPGVLGRWKKAVENRDKSQDQLWRDYTQAVLTPPRDQAGGPE